jgi:enterochelin esterase-like enzyme
MDNLIAEKRAEPMVIVMPLLHAISFDAPPIENNDVLGRYLLEDVLPLAESKYRVMKDRAHRALIGLSLGGAAALVTGLNHPELFSRLAAYSTGGTVSRDRESGLLPPSSTARRSTSSSRCSGSAAAGQDPLLETSARDREAARRS